MSPFMDRVETNAAKLVQSFLVENHLLTAIAGQLNILGEKDGFLRANIFAETTIGAPRRIDVEGDRIFLDVALLDLTSDDSNSLRRSDFLT